MIEIPDNFSEMSWLQILIVCMKFIIYIDSSDIIELNDQTGGSTAVSTNPEQPILNNNHSTDETQSASQPNPNPNPNTDETQSASQPNPNPNPNMKSNNNKPLTPAPLIKGNLNTPANNNVMNEALRTDDLYADKDVANQTGYFNNNLIVYMLKNLLSAIKRVSKVVADILAKLFAQFIFAATFPAMPFFLAMGAMFSFIKYGAFKIRGL